MTKIDCPTVDEFNVLFLQACEDHQNQKYQEAKKGYQKLISYFADAPILHYNLGLLFFDMQEYKEAIESFLRAEKENPEDTDIVFNLGLTYRKVGDNIAAIKQYNRVLELEPDSLDAIYNLGCCYRDENDYDSAVAFYEKVIGRESNHLAATNSLAYVYQRQGDTEKAVHYYKKVLELNPEHKAAAHMLAALTGAEVSTTPKNYVQDVFDNYSDHYEKSLVVELEYAVPEKIKEFVSKGEKWKQSFKYGLDLGCGTGLSGEAFCTQVQCIDGVDLAPKMLEVARDKKIYAGLYASEINEFLEGDVGPYDFVLAADVFGYLGDLENTFSLIYDKTAEDVLFCFSTEKDGGENYSLRPTGRFAHSVAYIENLANQTSWKIAANHPSSLRKEQGEWIEGNLWFLIKV